jgi:hypothetical protein
MVGVQEAVVVIRHARNVNQAFHERLDQLDKQTEPSHASHVAGEFVTHLVRHEPDLLPLHDLAFRVLGSALHRRHVSSHLRQLIPELVLPLGRQRTFTPLPE